MGKARVSLWKWGVMEGLSFFLYLSASPLSNHFLCLFYGSISGGGGLEDKSSVPLLVQWTV